MMARHTGDIGPRYWLAPSSFIAITDTGVVVLDLRTGRYLGVTPAQSLALSGLVVGWDNQVEARRWTDAPSTAEALAIAANLARRGLLTTDCAIGKTAARTVWQDTVPRFALHEEAEALPRVRAADALTFLRCCIRARWSLRNLPFHQVVSRIGQRKAASGDGTFDAVAATEAVCRFRYLRSWAFVADGECLFRAVALIEFLAAYSLYPALMIGVRTQPFGAHAWVQQGEYILDTTPERVSFYAPIFSV